MTLVEKHAQVIIYALDIVVVAFVLASNGFVHTNPNVRVFTPPNTPYKNQLKPHGYENSCGLLDKR